MRPIHVGTSGWQYKHWKGTFYPGSTSQANQFREYVKTFNTVEINNSFYRMPAFETFKKWKADAPPDFIYAVKASRYITHMKKLHDAADALQLLLRNSVGLGNKSGPILFQLPPAWNLNLDRLKEFLSILPRRKRFVFEFRNQTWYDERVYSLLRKKHCAFCIYELDRHQSPLEVTTDFVYVRLHGPGSKYQGSYSDDVLENWAKRCLTWAHQELEVFVYFDNDQNGYAALNARTLKSLLKSVGL